MTLEQLKTFLGAQTYTTESQLELTFLDYLDLGRKRVYNDIIEKIGDVFFYDYFIASTVAGQNEYTLPANSSTVAGLKKIISVELKRNNTDGYKLLRNDNYTEYQNSQSYIENNQPSGLGFYDVKDSSIFIYPTPSESIADGLKIHGVTGLIDLVDGLPETGIFPRHSELRDWHYVIALASKPYIFQEKGLYNEKANAEVEYQTELDRMLRSIGRKVGPTEGKLPDLSFYK